MLTYQVVREYFGQYNRGSHGYKQLILSDGNLTSPVNSIYSLYHEIGYYHQDQKQRVDDILGIRSTLKKLRDSCIVLKSNPVISSQEGSGVHTYFSDSSDPVEWEINGLHGTYTIYSSGGWVGDRKHNNIKVGSDHYWLSSESEVVSSPTKITASASEYIIQMYVKNGITKSLLNTLIDTSGSQNTNIEQNKGIALQRLSSKISDQIVAGDYICFQGDGDLSVTVNPVIKGTLTHVNTKGSNVSQTFTGTQTITINPDEYNYEDDGNGLYTIKLTCNNVTLSELKLLDSSDVFTWDKIRVPDKSMYADYSKNPYELNMSWQTGSYFTNNWEHDGYFYTNKNNGGYSTEFGNSEIVADRHSLTYSEIPYEIYNFCDEDWSSSSNRKMKRYFSSGLTRIYTPSNRSLWKDCAFSDYIAQSPQTISFLMQTGTLPINTALYYAYHDNSTNEAEWYTNSKGEYEYDASEAAKNVTVAACKKLKNDWKQNLRIYLIKYRKQAQYKHKVTSDVTDYNYGYLDECAGEYSETSPDSETNTDTETPPDPVDTNEYVFDVATEEDLKSTMKTIAEKIKPWAEYKEAKNVTP